MNYTRGTAKVRQFGEQHERQDWGGLDMYEGKMMSKLAEGC